MSRGANQIFRHRLGWILVLPFRALSARLVGRGSRRAVLTLNQRRLITAGFALLITGWSAAAADLKLEARLIWGANDSPSTINHNLVDGELTTALRHNFPKWTNYYEITNLTSAIPLNETRDLRISDHCTLKVKNLGGLAVAVDCIGQGKQVSKGTNTLPCIYSGTATNDTGWFIQLRTVEEKK